MPDSGSPTVRRRRLAGELHRLREHSGMTGEEVAERLGWAGSKVSRIERARSGLKLVDVRRLLDLYEVEGAHRDELIALARDAAKKGWWETYTDTLQEEHIALIGLETEAEAVRTWQPQVVPGLLQTAAYARETVGVWQAVAPMPPTLIERRVEARMKRQHVLEGDAPLHLHAVIDESVLLRRFGDNSVMAEQLAALIEFSRRPNITLRVLPLDVRHPVCSDSFVHMRFPAIRGAPFHDVAYIEHLRSGIYVENEAESHEYFLAFETLSEASLDPVETRKLLSEIAEKVWT